LPAVRPPSGNNSFTADADAGFADRAETKMNLVQAALLTAFPLLVVAAALTDAASFTIPNRISALLVVTFVPAALALGVPLGEMGVHAAVFIAALLVGMGLFAAGWVGGGDAKLLAAASVWLGLQAMPVFLIATALAGGALSVLLMNIRASWLQPYLARGPAWFARLATPGADVPYGVAIAVGALAAFPHSAPFQAFHSRI
jgi:prepilin peptidase CpaA